MSDPTVISFHFDNEEAAQHFLVWLSESGEQEYWDWMEYREEDEEKGDITALDFDYWSLNEGKTFGPKIKMKCGRMDRRD
jgi:hypothetical protein